MHIVLLGDSIFDNAPYTAGGPAFIGKAVDDFVELRDLLNEPIHYANPIEPSVEGGRILAEEILRRARSWNQ
jgi:hypothetical protein